MANRKDSSRLPRPVCIKDPTVKKLTDAWLGIFPESLDISLGAFLTLSSTESNRQGRIFAEQHRRFVESILLNYAMGVTQLTDITESNMCEDTCSFPRFDSDEIVPVDEAYEVELDRQLRHMRLYKN